MIFIYPLQRNGFYYMSHKSYVQHTDSEEVIQFNKIITELNADIKKLKHFYLITIKSQKHD